MPRSMIIKSILAVTAITIGLGSQSAFSAELEKDTLTFGFIKLTDMAPLAIAKELGYFEDEGLEVELEAQANWKVLLNGVIDGQLDGAHMLAGQPIAATIGYGTKAHIITPFSMDLNGNAITVSNAVWAEMKKTIPHENSQNIKYYFCSAIKYIQHYGSRRKKQLCLIYKRSYF